MLKNNFSIQEPLTEKNLELIHNNTVKILEEEGIKITNEEVLQIFKDHDVKTKGNKVYLNQSTVEKAIAKIPDSFTLIARNPANSVDIGGKVSVLGPALGPPFIIENNKQEYATYGDYLKLIKLIHSNPYMDLIGGEMVPPTDIKEKDRHKKMFYAASKYSDKCLIGTGTGYRKTRDCLRMGEILFGKNNLRKNHCIFKLIGTSSPLQYNNEPLETLLNWSRSGQPLGIYSQIMAGMTGPYTLAGTLTLQNAEILSGAVLVQLINPGNPVIYGSFSSVTDMNTGEINVGNSEYSKIIGATAQIANYYDLPSMVGGGLTDSGRAGAQAGYETMLNMFTAVGSGIDIILFSAGAIKNYMGISFEKLITDNEILKTLNHFQSGININKDTIARDIISEIGSGGNYLTHPHTLDQLEKKDHSGKQYKKDEKKEELATILSEYKQPAFDSEIEEKLLEFIK